jgi:hypothetical protein
MADRGSWASASPVIGTSRGSGGAWQREGGGDHRSMLISGGDEGRRSDFGSGRSLVVGLAFARRRSSVECLSMRMVGGDADRRGHPCSDVPLLRWCSNATKRVARLPAVALFRSANDTAVTVFNAEAAVEVARLLMGIGRLLYRGAQWCPGVARMPRRRRRQPGRNLCR